GRGLLAAQLEQVTTRDYQAILLAEAVDEAQEAGSVLGGDGCRLGGWGRTPRAEAFGQPQLEMPAPPGGAHAVSSFVGDYLQQPGSRFRTCAEAAEGAEGL